MRNTLFVALATLLAIAACDKGSESKPADDTADKKPAVGGDKAPDEKPAANKPAATSEKAPVGAPKAWHESRLSQGYRFETPIIPTKSTDAASGITNYQVKADNHYFMVQTMKMPEFLVGALKDESALAAGFAKAEENMLATMNAKALKKAERMKIAGMDANELVAAGVQGGQKFEVTARQIIDAKAGMLYQMMLLHPGGPANADMHRQFFDSFKPTSK